jgi:hypothetical protein
LVAQGCRRAANAHAPHGRASRVIAAPPQHVYAALVNPEALTACGRSCLRSKQLAADGRAENHDRIPPRSRSFPNETTEHPALIPQEAPGGSRPRPRIPATTGAESLRFTGIPAYPRSTRKRHDRPVTPEVAGSSPVAPVQTCKIGSFVAQAGANDRRSAFIPRTSRTGIPAESRAEPLIPATRAPAGLTGVRGLCESAATTNAPSVRTDLLRSGRRAAPVHCCPSLQSAI